MTGPWKTPEPTPTAETHTLKPIGECILLLVFHSMVMCAFFASAYVIGSLYGVMVGIAYLLLIGLHVMLCLMNLIKSFLAVFFRKTLMEILNGR